MHFLSHISSSKNEGVSPTYRLETSTINYILNVRQRQLWKEKSVPKRLARHRRAATLFSKFGIPKKFRMWPPAALKARRINLFPQTPMENFGEKASACAAHVNTAARVRSSSKDRKQVLDVRWQNRRLTDKIWKQGTDDQEILYCINSRVCGNNSTR